MDKRIAIVTGAGRLIGIGNAICLELANRGCDIFFTYWSAYDSTMSPGTESNEPELIEEKVRSLGVRCEKLELDLTKENAIELLLNTVEENLGHPSILINNATYSTGTTIEDLSAQELDKHYELNIKAATLLTIEFIKRFKYGSNGRIINLTSGQSLGPMPGEIAYAMTKSAIEMLTYTLSSEIAAKGITINTVNPGPNDTGWMSEELKEELISRFPMGRIGQPTDTAKLIGFLTSEDAEWITGQIIHSEGGFKR